MKMLVSKSPVRLVYILSYCLLIAGYSSKAQQSVSIGTTEIKNNAVLNLVSPGKNQGLIIPIVSNKSAVAAPNTGMIVYDESDHKLYYRNNTTWLEISGTSGGGIVLSGDLSGTSTAAVISKLQGKNITAATPANGQILKFNGSNQTWELATEAAAYTAGTGISIGANQISISNDGVTTTQIAPNTVTNADLNKTAIPVSGFGAATVSVDMGNQKIINMGAPTLNTDATTKTYVDAADATKLATNTLTTNGDILYHNGTAVTRLPKGSNGQALLSTATTLQWTTLTSLTNPMTAAGDLIVGGASGTPARLAGTAGFLKSTGAVTPAWSAVNLNSSDVTGALPLANGGTGATTNTAARTNLGLGTLSTLNAVTTTEITDGTIVNADVATAAAIAGTKIAPNFGTQDVVTTGNIGAGIATAATKLHVATSTATTTPLVNIQQQNAGGDASLSFLAPTQNYSIGSTSTGSFKIANSTALGTNDHFEITPGVADGSGLAKMYLDMGPRGMDGLQVHSTSDWGTSIHISNGVNNGTLSGYTMAVTGPSGPTSQAGDFALVAGIGSVFSIGRNTGVSSYCTNFPAVDQILGGSTPMRVGINLSSTGVPGYNLEVVGSAAKNTGPSWTNTSDIRLKKDVSKFNDGLNVITKINPIWFRYNGKGGTHIGENLQVGVAAQEMKEIAPYTVGTFKAKYDDTSPDEQEFYNFDYSAIGYAMINAIKELDKKVTELEKENELLKQQLQDKIPNSTENDTSLQLKAELDTQKLRTDQLEAELKEIKRLLYMEAKQSDK
jgi:hypothetical protein